MEDITADIRLAMDVRVSGFKVNSFDNNVISSNTDYNYNRVYGEVLLPNDDSYAIYEISITNLGNAKAGISKMNNSNPNLKITLLDYNIGDAFCVDGSYTLGITQKILLKIEYANGVIPNEEKQLFNIELSFGQFHSIVYHGVPGEENHPTEIMDGFDLVIETELTLISRLKITQDTVFLLYGESYFYDESAKILTVKNVTGDLLLSYRDISYLTNLASDSGYYKESAYKDTIVSVEFVNYVDIENAVKTYDLSENKDNSIIGWIEDNGNGTYNLYVGSIYDIYTKNFESAFAYMYGLQYINFENLNTSESTAFNYTFYKTKIYNLDLSTFNTSSAVGMINMFAEMTNLQTLDVSNFNTSNVTNMWYMFGGMSSITELDISTFDTSNVTNMGYMFSGMTKLKTLNLGQNFKTSKVTTMENMFTDLSALESLDLRTFSTTSLTTTRNMFFNCSSLKSLDLSSFRMSNVINMGYMFYGMNQLETLNIENFDTSNCTNMESMFAYCYKLSALDLTKFNTSKVTTMKRMFMYLTEVQELDLSSFDISKVSNMENLFAYCYKLNKIDFRQASFGNVIFTTTMFNGVPNTVTVIAKDEEAKAWLESKMAMGTVVIYTPPAEEGADGSDTTT